MMKSKKWKVSLFTMMLILMMSVIPVQAVRTVSMKKGQEKNLSVVLTLSQLDSGLATASYTWHSTNTGVVKVAGTSRVARVYAVGNGTCYVSASTTGAYCSWKITVGSGGSSGTTGNKTTTKKVTVKSVKLNKTSLTLNVGKTQTLKYTVSPKTAKTTVGWTSSNTRVASVNGGKVTAKNPGKATITVKTANGKKKSCKVTVKAPAKKVTMSHSSLTLGKGDKFKLTATVSPTNTTDKWKWSSSNKKLATVNSKGQVTAKKSGRVTITAKCGSKKATCSIKIAKSKIKKINPRANYVEVGMGSTALLGYTFTPSDADGMLTWSSSNTNVVKVNQNGKVTPVSTGTATVTVKASSGASAKYTVKVTVPATRVTLDTSSLTVRKGKTASLFAMVTPFDTTDKITWKSGNTSIATVSASGKVTGVSAGTTYIQAIAGSCVASCQVTVDDSADISEATILIYDGYYQYAYYATDKMSEKIPFDRTKGIRLTQSNRNVSNYIEICERPSNGTLRLVLSNVETGGIDSVGGNLILELEPGTSNVNMNGIRVKGDLTICGAGSLTARNYSSAISANTVRVAGGATVTAYSELESSAPIDATNGLTIESGSHVAQYRETY